MVRKLGASSGSWKAPRGPFWTSFHWHVVKSQVGINIVI